ncbi:MAG: NADH:ubiquinone reductase (Na(+)-transporting) subunit C [Bacteroidales bacterium]|nr:NADH:ubiquinone reductase (Na(+)-transporting) subunit C [Bacteroidales bacterium]
MERSNTYIIVYSVVMVVFVAAVLSIASFSLQDKQQENVEIEKIQDMLMSINVIATTGDAKILFEKYIKQQLVINTKGEIVEGKKPFALDLKKEYAEKPDNRNLPLYIAQKNDSIFYIIPLRGKGLWGPIWGYVSLLSDKSTVYGATFDHKSETPGLGAEINKPFFEKQFIGKMIYDSEKKFKSVNVIKGGAPQGDVHGVDAISGGTITSVGVDAMIDTCIIGYDNYLKQQN